MEKQSKPTTIHEARKEKENDTPEEKHPVTGEASEFPRLFKVAQERRQQPKPAPPTKGTSASTGKGNKRKKADVADSEQPETEPKKKKASDAPGKLLRTSLDKFLEAKADVAHDTKESNVDTGNELSTNTLQRAPAMGVHYGLLQNTSLKFNMEATCVFPEHRKPILNCLLNGSVRFKGSSILDEQDLQRLYGCKAHDEDNYLTNFVIEAYLHLLQS